MGETQIFKCFSFSIILIMFFIRRTTASEVYTVGDELQWNTGANFGSWSQKYNFSIGDTLVFKYVKGQHNVYEVTEATYRSCNATTGVLATYDSGNDQIPLNQAKKYWYICNIDGHCLGGMRFFINVKEAESTDIGPISPQSEPIPPPPAPSSCPTIYAFERWSLWIHFIALGVILQFYA